ncbi:hypothetical protein JCGZ_01248 [Jatropha curcas]|uniref:Uncharacterized protein n=1 Tax=Jatropha curcas TaxID=180498 RepID=A0A067LC26_JATCU|nr:hypothetical protein JCGZ_01248 [Jatropha curcas]
MEWRSVRLSSVVTILASFHVDRACSGAEGAVFLATVALLHLRRSTRFLAVPVEETGTNQLSTTLCSGCRTRSSQLEDRSHEINSRIESLVDFESSSVIVVNFWAVCRFRPPCTAFGGNGPVTGRRHSGEASRDRTLFSSR